MRRWAAFAVLAFASLGTGARAVTLGGTVLIDRPSGFGALPFDGIAGSSVVAHSMTPDGRYVVFTSQSNALLSGDEDSALNVYRVDLTTGAVVQVDTTASGGQPDPGSQNSNASISTDGNHVGFFTTSPAIDPAASPTSRQFVVKNLTTGAIELASRATGASGAPVSSLGFAVLSGDGRHVAFSASSPIVADNATGVAGTTDAYLRSLDTNVTHMESVTSPGGAEGGGVQNPLDIDYGGDAVAFITSSALVPGDSDTSPDAYVHIAAGSTLLASFSGGGQAPAADGADEVAVVGGPAALEVAWSSGSAEWIAPCAGACITPATRVDHARTGGTDSNANKSTPFFPPETGATLPARVYWTDYDGLDPADTNNAPDVYGWDIGNTAFNTSIHLMTPASPNAPAGAGSATDSGSVTAYASSSPTLPGSNGQVQQVYVRRMGVDTNISQPIGQPTRTDDAGFGFLGQLHAVSDDGRFVTFASVAPAFGAPIEANGPAEQVLVRDVVTGTTQLISAAPDGSAGNGSSSGESIDAAGDKVVFQSGATNLVPGDTNGKPDVFVRDLTTGKTTLVDRTAGGGFPLDGAGAPQISADGTKVVYLSKSVDIPGAPADSEQHAYEVDLGTGDVTLVDRATDGTVANDTAFGVDVDGDGRRVAFLSRATNLGGGSQSVYVRDLTDPTHPTTTWASIPQGGAPANDTASPPSIDRDGGRVAFAESNAGFGFGMTGRSQVFVRDLGAQTTTLASTGASGPADGFVGGPSISDDGSRVSFTSSADNLPGAVANASNVFVRDLAAGTTTLGAARDASASSGRFGAGGGSLSGNGACLAFSSSSDDLVNPSYGSDFQHIFLHALSADCPSGGSQPDTTPPVIARLSVSHKRFAVGGKPTAVSAAKHHHRHRKAPRGTTFRFTLSEAAVTKIAITQKVKGHRASRKKRCAPARRGQKRNCTRTITVVTLTRAHTAQGQNSVAFSGRFGKKRLAKGSYRATVTATDAAGNRSKTRSVSFTVVGG